jgi:hypothetical protein
MMLFKARQKAEGELERALEQRGMSQATFEAKLSKSAYGKKAFKRPPHKMAGVTTNLVYAL